MRRIEPERLRRLKRGWDMDEGGWKSFVIFWLIVAFLAWAALS